jgi:hypothetical protein
MTDAAQEPLEIAELLRLQTFAPHIGSGFSVLRGTDWVTLNLTEAKASGRQGKENGGNFSLVFSAGPEMPLQQGIHEFRHPVLGGFELFITPIMCPLREFRWYEAVINRQSDL